MRVGTPRSSVPVLAKTSTRSIDAPGTARIVERCAFSDIPPRADAYRRRAGNNECASRHSLGAPSSAVIAPPTPPTAGHDNRSSRRRQGLVEAFLHVRFKLRAWAPPRAHTTRSRRDRRHAAVSSRAPTSPRPSAPPWDLLRGHHRRAREGKAEFEQPSWLRRLPGFTAHAGGSGPDDPPREAGRTKRNHGVIHGDLLRHRAAVPTRSMGPAPQCVVVIPGASFLPRTLHILASRRALGRDPHPAPPGGDAHARGSALVRRREWSRCPTSARKGGVTDSLPQRRGNTHAAHVSRLTAVRARSRCWATRAAAARGASAWRGAQVDPRPGLHVRENLLVTGSFALTHAQFSERLPRLL